MNLRYYLRGLGIGIFVTALIMGVAVKSHPQKMSESEIRAEAAKLGMVDGRTVLQQASEQDGEADENDMEVAEESEEDEQTVSKNDITNEADDVTEDEEDGSNVSEEEDVTKENQDVDDLESNDSQDADDTNPDGENGQGTEETNVTETPDVNETNTNEKHSDDVEEIEQPNEEEEESQSVETARQYVTVVVYPGEGSLAVAKRLEVLGVVENAVVYDKFLCRNGYDRRIRVGNFSIPVDASNEEIARIITSR